MPAERLEEYRPNRNFVRVGDMVACDPPGKARRFLATVTRIENTVPVTVHVKVEQRLNGSTHPQAGRARAFTADRVTRVAQTRHKART